MSDDLIRRSDVMLCIECARTPTAYGEEVRRKILDGVMRIPSADRPQGEWILVCDAEGEGDNLYRCSVCGHECGCQEYDLPNYCGTCGARNERSRR